MKRPAPDLYNVKVIRLATKFLVLPLVIGAAVFRWSKGRLGGLRSDDRKRADDRLRQSRVRRKLRGLPEDHVQGAAGPAVAKRVGRNV